MNDKELRRYLNVIKRAVALIEANLDNDDGGLLEQFLQPTQPGYNMVAPAPEVQHVPQPVQPVVQQGPSAEEIKAHEIARAKHINDLLSIDVWPEAVPSFMISDPSDEDQIHRADAVLDMMINSGTLEGAKFLDFGCGEGWVAQRALARGCAEAAGFDTARSDTWKRLTGPTFTHVYNELKRSYYDVVFLYDVLDHCQDPVGLMNQVQSVLKRDGSVYVRCHPWVSVHGGHLYKQGLNKAFIHLFLTPDELAGRIGAPPMFVRPEKDPLTAYHWWFNNFEIKKEIPIRRPVNPFFHVQAFKELLGTEQQIPLAEIDAFLKLMEVQFVDFCLTPKK